MVLAAYIVLGLIGTALIPLTTKKLFAVRTDDYKSDLYIKNMDVGITIAIIMNLIGLLVLMYLVDKFQLNYVVVIYHILMLFGVSVAVATDLHARLIPHKLTHPLLIVGLASSAIYKFGVARLDFGHFGLYVILPIVGVWLFFMGFNLLTRGDGIGHGDILLFMAIATVKGIFIVPIVTIALIIGSIAMPIQRLMFKIKVFPLGPYIALAYIGWIFVEYNYLMIINLK